MILVSPFYFPADNLVVFRLRTCEPEIRQQFSSNYRKMRSVQRRAWMLTLSSGDFPFFPRGRPTHPFTRTCSFLFSTPNERPDTCAPFQGQLGVKSVIQYVTASQVYVFFEPSGTVKWLKDNRRVESRFTKRKTRSVFIEGYIFVSYGLLKDYCISIQFNIL